MLYFFMVNTKAACAFEDMWDGRTTDGSDLQQHVDCLGNSQIL